MNICVYCGSRTGQNPAYAEAAGAVGTAIAQNGDVLVFGGGKVGLMGVLAEAVLAGGGRAIGVMPRHLIAREVAHEGLSELHQVDSMHERKLKMSRLSDAFLALPGGTGTLDEMFEQWTWAQLGLHHKPIGFLDVDGYYRPLAAMVDHMAAQGFVDAAQAKLPAIAADFAAIMRHFNAYTPPTGTGT